VVKLLLETRKVDVDARDGQCSRTPLACSASRGHTGVVKLLLATGQVDINAKDDVGMTPLSWAAKDGQYGVVKLLPGVLGSKDEAHWSIEATD